jgi:vitamin K-dependent gamma-carboxylase
MCLQFAHFLAEELKKDGHERIEIRVETKVSLNGRESQYFIDPEVDLSKKRRNLWHAEWILPLETPLPNRKGKPGLRDSQ